MKKVLNVVGIFAAVILSIVLVLMLLATPIIFSTLSLLNGQTVTKVVTDMFTAGQEAQPSAEKAEIVTLSNTTQTAENVGEDLLAGMFGDAVSQEQLSAILSSNAAKELIEAYTGDLTNAITGSNKAAAFNADKIKSIVNDNIDEIVQVLQANVPECANMSADELKTNIQKAVNENAEEIVNSLPKPEEIKQQLVESVPALETAMNILEMKNTIKLAIIGVIVVLSGLIFVCRIPGMRGFRWLAVDLFVAGGLNLLTSVGLLFSKSAVGEIAKEAGVQIANMVGSLLSTFTGGILIRAVVMLVAGGGLLTTYIFIKKAKAKKVATAEEPSVVEMVAEQSQV